MHVVPITPDQLPAYQPPKLLERKINEINKEILAKWVDGSEWVTITIFTNEPALIRDTYTDAGWKVEYGYGGYSDRDRMGWYHFRFTKPRSTSGRKSFPPGPADRNAYTGHE